MRQVVPGVNLKDEDVVDPRWPPAISVDPKQEKVKDDKEGSSVHLVSWLPVFRSVNKNSCQGETTLQWTYGHETLRLTPSIVELDEQTSHVKVKPCPKLNCLSLDFLNWYQIFIHIFQNCTRGAKIILQIDICHRLNLQKNPQLNGTVLAIHPLSGCPFRLNP